MVGADLFKAKGANILLLAIQERPASSFLQAVESKPRDSGVHGMRGIPT